jgi:hypothetical protein
MGGFSSVCRQSVAKLVTCFVLSLTCQVTHASWLSYGLRFEIEDGTVFSRSAYDPESEPHYTVTESDAGGNVYYGAFAIDSAILETDGLGKPGDLGFFVIKMEDNIWGYNFPINNSFRGFRGPIPDCPSSACLGALSPGFDVVDGEITSLRGGVFGSGDVPFVDFGYSGPNTFGAHGLGVSLFHPTSWLVGSGHMDVFRVSEPGSLALLSFALFAFVFVRTRRSSARKEE